MTTTHVFDSFLSLFPSLSFRGSSKRALRALTHTSLMVLGLGWAAQAHASECSVYDESGSIYPALSEATGPDLLGEDQFLVYLDLGEALIDLDGCLRWVDRTVEIEFGDRDVVTVLLELPPSTEGWTLFMSHDGVWTETIETASTRVAVTLWSDSGLELELAAPGQQRPIKPLVVLEPSPPNPAPSGA